MKTTIAVLSVLTLGFALFAEDEINMPPQELTFRQVRNAALSEKKANSIKTARIIYALEGEHTKNAGFIVRLKRTDKIRIDVFSGGKFYVACRDNDTYWGFQTGMGSYDMSKEEALELNTNAAFLPIPFMKQAFYNAPEFKKNDTVGKTPCYLFNVTSNYLPGETLQMWITQKGYRLQKVRSESDEGIEVTLYRDYKNFNGILLPRRVQVSGPDRFHTLILKSAEWNTDIPDELFQKTKKPIDEETVALLESIHKKEIRAKKQEAKDLDQMKLTQLKKKCEKLKIEIQAMEKEMAQIEQIVKDNRNSTEKAITAPQYAPRYKNCWSTFGWGGYYRSNNTRELRYRRKYVRSLEKENAELVKRYDDLSSRIVKRRQELADAEEDLKAYQQM